MQIQIWKNQHPDGCARPSCIKTSSVFPLHKHIPVQHTFQHTDSTYYRISAEESLPYVVCCRDRTIKPKLQSASSSQGTTFNSRQYRSTDSLQRAPPEQQRELNGHHRRRAWLKPAELGQGFCSLGIVSTKEKSNKEIIAFLWSTVVYTQKANTVI